MLKGHGGNSIELARRLGCLPQEIIDMSSNINPLGPPPGLIQHLKDHINAVGKFPEVDSREITALFADKYGVGADRALAGNGTTQFIYELPQALGIKRALILGPTYSDYADACRLNQVETTFVIAEESQNFQPNLKDIKKYVDDVDCVFICNPNNPTGSLIPAEDIKALCRTYPDTIFIVDESYLSFIQGADKKSIRRQDLANLIVLISISKIFAIPGLRIGFVVSSAERIKQLRRYLQPWSVNSLAQLATGYLMVQEDEVNAFIEKTHQLITAERNRFAAMFEDVPDITLFPSATNYLIARLHSDLNANAVCSRLAGHKILIRNCSNFKGLSDRHIRISFKQPKHNRVLAQKLLEMVQTESNQGQANENRIGIGGR
jgi:threonine-phosphate decarboxylase